MTVSQTQLISVTTGAKANANIHVGSFALADSTRLKTTLVLGRFQSISTAGLPNHEVPSSFPFLAAAALVALAAVPAHAVSTGSVGASTSVSTTVTGGT